MGIGGYLMGGGILTNTPFRIRLKERCKCIQHGLHQTLAQGHRHNYGPTHTSLPLLACANLYVCAVMGVCCDWDDQTCVL